THAVLTNCEAAIGRREATNGWRHIGLPCPEKLVMLRRFGLIFGLFLIPLIAAPAAQADRRVALVIGNSAYVNAAALRNPKNDAADIAETLKKLGFEVELGLDLDQRGLAQTIEKFGRELEGADVGLFFYAGHALQISDKNYLVSTTARLEN